MNKAIRMAIPPGTKYVILLSCKADSKKIPSSNTAMRSLAKELPQLQACTQGSYAGQDAVAIVCEERPRKRWREAQDVTCEASGYAAALLNREVYRMNAMGFFAGKVAPLIMDCELLFPDQYVSEEGVRKQIMDYCGFDMEKVE